MKDYFLIGIKNIGKRRLRSWLTMLGIFVGIAAVVALVSISQGMQNAIAQEFKKVGSNRIIITPGGAFFGPLGAELTPAQLTEKDVDVVKRVKGVKTVDGILGEITKVKFRDKTKQVSVWGTPVDSESRKMLEEIGFFSIEKGRQIKEGDKYKANLGNKIAYDLFDKPIKTGDKIYIDDVEFEVVGIQKPAGTGVHDIIIRIPKQTARDLFNEPEKISSIFTVIQDGLNPTEVAEKIKEKLRKSRNVKKGEEDFSVQTAEQVIKSFTIILGAVQALLIGIASISFIVGGVGIMNTMYTAVLERIKEIGVMKAIGAKNKDIMFIFLIESGLLGTIGGVIGIVLGLGISKGIELIANSYGLTTLKASMNIFLILGALLFSFLVGVISGSLPARQASLMQPVKALRKIR